MRRRRHGQPSRVASFLLVLGCLTVLGSSFGAGVWAGRHWPGLMPSLRGPSIARADGRNGATMHREPNIARTDGRNGATMHREQATHGPSRAGGTRYNNQPGLAAPSTTDRSGPTDPASKIAAPVLTFYQELTAPLTSPPPAKPKAERPKPGGLQADGPKGEAAPPAGPSPPEVATPASPPPEPLAPDARARQRFTVQVGAFSVREQADALRARLAASGHDAYVAEIEGREATRYRVRIGDFASRDEAREAAQRVATAERVATYVTIR